MRVNLRSYPVDTGRKLNVHKTFRRRPGRLLNVLCTFNLRPVSTGYKIRKIPSLVDFHILYQLLHSQVYRSGLKLLISNVKICVDNCEWLISGSYITQLNKINEGELDSCQKFLLIKIDERHKKSSPR